MFQKIRILLQRAQPIDGYKDGKKEGVFDQMLIHLLRQSQEEELTDCQRLMVDGSFSPCEDGR